MWPDVVFKAHTVGLHKIGVLTIQTIFLSRSQKKIPPCCRPADCSWTPESSSHQARTKWAPVGLCRRLGPLSSAEHLTETPARQKQRHRTEWSAEPCEIQPSQLETRADSAVEGTEGSIKQKYAQVCSARPAHVLSCDTWLHFPCVHCTV